VFKHKALSLAAAYVTFALLILVACRTRPDEVSPTEDSTALATQQPLPEVAGEPDVVEVTRIIVETEVVEVTPEPGPEELPQKELVICIADEPATLYPYARSRMETASSHVLHGLYESMYTTLSYDYQARGLEKLPGLADGDAVIDAVEVQSGDLVYDVNENVVSLAEGVKVVTADGQQVAFDGTPIQMAQMAVQFTMKPLIWSDGNPVTADDSVYSFELAADPQTPVPKGDIERTASYISTGDLTLEWKGVPGYLAPDYFTRIWTPYPRHYWGELSAVELLSAEETNLRPLSHGPYLLSEWIPGESITLVRNEHYYLADDNLPRVDRIRFNFMPNGSQLLAQLVSGQCDIGTHEGIGAQDLAFLNEGADGGQLAPHFQSGTVFEHIDFGINPVEQHALQRADWFEDARVRQAFLMCTDRQRIVDELFFGRAEIIQAYVPSIHPLYPEDATLWTYDVAAANELLDSAGFLDSDEDGVREDPGLGGAFKVSLLSPLGNANAEQIATIFSDNLADCGVSVELSYIDSDRYFADGPDGPLFGRQFDLATFPWLIGIEPNCALYLSSRVPGPENGWNRSYNNETGFSNAEFDAACEAALSSLPGTPEHKAYHQEAIRIWTEQVPTIPLFLRLKVAATRPGVQNFVVDPTQSSELWNLYEIDVE
jgi:peptide/nickel transport system substrate-binding protein